MAAVCNLFCNLGSEHSLQLRLGGRSLKRSENTCFTAASVDQHLFGSRQVQHVKQSGSPQRLRRCDEPSYPGLPFIREQDDTSEASTTIFLPLIEAETVASAGTRSLEAFSQEPSEKMAVDANMTIRMIRTCLPSRQSQSPEPSQFGTYQFGGSKKTASHFVRVSVPGHLQMSHAWGEDA